MAFCEVSQEQTPGTDAYAGDFGFKVLTASDPAEKTKKLNAEIANGRLAMMAIIGMFFQAEIGFCARIVPYNSARQETPQRLWLRERQVLQKESRVSVNVPGVFWVYEVNVLPAMLSARSIFFDVASAYCALLRCVTTIFAHACQ